jgi:uncharacterized ion transporter superfamily protein YfcC
MATGGAHSSGRPNRLHPALIMLAMMLIVVALTHVIPAGKFNRVDKHVVPGTYHVVPKVNGLAALLSPMPPAESDSPARAAGVVALFTAIPTGMTGKSSLLFMVMFVGGMFGVLRATGAIDSGVDRLLQLISGNVYLLTTALMFLLACGSTFLGFISEYLALMPLMLALGQRLGLPNLFAPAVVWIASVVGYSASVTNPIVLAVAQPLAGIPVFSGILPRLVIFSVMFALGAGYMLLYLRRLPKIEHIPGAARLSVRHVSVLISVVLCATALVTGTALWSWGNTQLAAAFIAFSVVLALVGGLRASTATEAFVDGMKGMLLVCLMIGLSGAIEVILQSSQVTDSVVQGLASLIHGHTRAVIAGGMMTVELMFGMLIHSMSALAGMSMPILTPIAHLSGVSGQVTVTTLLLGSGVSNLVAPTSGLLLAFLAASKVGFSEWIRFIAPLFVVLYVVGQAALFAMVTLGV